MLCPTQEQYMEVLGTGPHGRTADDMECQKYVLLVLNLIQGYLFWIKNEGSTNCLSQGTSKLVSKRTSKCAFKRTSKMVSLTDQDRSFRRITRSANKGII